MAGNIYKFSNEVQPMVVDETFICVVVIEFQWFWGVCAVVMGPPIPNRNLQCRYVEMVHS